MSIIIGGAIAGMGLWLRAAASGQVRKNEALAMSGPYAYTRNPLYLGSLIIAAGFGAASRNPWVAVVIIVFFLAIYLPVIKSEEEFLASKFAEFENYRRNVPRLLPRLRRRGAASAGFSRALYMQHREYNALLGSALMMVALSLKVICATGT
jgi:protein-S-isoprenylcysteine O-methyltransferase Ste14